MTADEIWLLRPPDDRSSDGYPWQPNDDGVFGLMIQASSERAARAAAKEWSDSGAGLDTESSVWEAPERIACIPLTAYAADWDEPLHLMVVDEDREVGVHPVAIEDDWLDDTVPIRLSPARLLSRGSGDGGSKLAVDWRTVDDLAGPSADDPARVTIVFGAYNRVFTERETRSLVEFGSNVRRCAHCGDHFVQVVRTRYQGVPLSQRGEREWGTDMYCHTCTEAEKWKRAAGESSVGIDDQSAADATNDKSEVERPDVPAPFDTAPVDFDPSDEKRERMRAQFPDAAVPDEGPIPDGDRSVPAEVDIVPDWVIEAAAYQLSRDDREGHDDEPARELLLNYITVSRDLTTTDGRSAETAVIDRARELADETNGSEGGAG
jgi:hypothetical protein